MPGANKVEHVRLQVDELDAAVDFYENSLGLGRIAEEDGVVYLGCGFDENYDFAIQQGDPGVEHFAFRVDGPDAIDAYEERLHEEGVETERTGGTEPGQEHGVRFTLPSGIAMELVTVADKSYKRYYRREVPGRDSVAPLDLNHYNFHTPIPEEDGTFLLDVLDFKPSAIIDDWAGGAFLRKGDAHHDLALLEHDGGPADHAAHHHTGVTVSSVEHMVKIIDEVVMNGGNLEMGIGRHHSGANLYAYIQAADGHRIELVTQMTELDDNTPPLMVDSVNQAISSWEENVQPPESWYQTSGLVD